MITTWYYPLLVTMLICIFGDFVDLAGIHRAYIKTDLAPVIVALEKYKTENNHYPDKLDELTPVYLNYDPSPSSWYIVDSKHRFRADPGEYKLGRPYTLPGFLNLYLYNSRTKTWKGEN